MQTCESAICSIHMHIYALSAYTQRVRTYAYIQRVRICVYYAYICIYTESAYICVYMLHMALFTYVTYRTHTKTNRFIFIHLHTYVGAAGTRRCRLERAWHGTYTHTQMLVKYAYICMRMHTFVCVAEPSTCRLGRIWFVTYTHTHKYFKIRWYAYICSMGWLRMVGSLKG